MKYFLDSAKIDEIRYAYENWAIDGVTTNPRHVYTSGKPFLEVINELSEYFKGTDVPVSVEIDPQLEKSEDMIEAARRVASLSENFVIKIGCTEQGLSAAKKLHEEGIRTNVTLVFSPTQALQAGRVGATFVSPFLGWKEASGEDCFQMMSDIVDIYENYEFSTEIIAAAVRNGKQIAEVAALGADIVTAGYQVYVDSFTHPFTDYGTKIFTDAWKQTDTSGV